MGHHAKRCNSLEISGITLPKQEAHFITISGMVNVDHIVWCCCFCFVRCFGRKARSDSFLGIQFDPESPEKYFEGEAEVNVVNLEHCLVINV